MNTQKQQGAVLAIGLILLLLMTILGSMSISRVNTSERLAGSERDINNAFQAAESALLEGERWLSDLTDATPPGTVITCGAGGTDCETAIWKADDVGSNGVRGKLSWQKINWDGLGRTLALNKPNAEMLEITEPPKYFIEYIGPLGGASAADDMYYYRITSRARGTTAASEVILQSVYRRKF